MQVNGRTNPTQYTTKKHKTKQKISCIATCCCHQVTVGQQSATGSGPNKKLAKRAAAEVKFF